MKRLILRRLSVTWRVFFYELGQRLSSSFCDSRMESRISSKAEQHTLTKVEYDDKSVPTDTLWNDYGTKEGMPSFGKAIAAEKSAVIADITNGNMDLDITTCRKPTADKNLASGLINGCEADMDDLSLVKDITDGNTAGTDKFKHGGEVHNGISISESIQDCSSNLSCSTSMKCASLAEKMEVLNGGFGISYGSGISVCLPEVDEQVVRDIPVDKRDPTEDKLPLCSDYNISVEKSAHFMASGINESYSHRGNLETIHDQTKAVEVEDKPGSRFVSKDCHPEEQGLLGLVVKGLMEDVLPYSAMNTTEDDKVMLDETFILDLSNTKDKFAPIFHERNKMVEWPGNGNVLVECSRGSVTLSSEQKNDISEFLAGRGEWYAGSTLDSSISSSINCLDVRLECSKQSKSLSEDSFVGTTLHVQDDFPFSTRYRSNEVDLSSCGVETKNTGITCNVNCADEFESSLVKGEAMKARDSNADLDSTNTFQLETNSLSVSEEDQAQVTVESIFASSVSHSPPSLDLARDTAVIEHLSGEVRSSVNLEEMTMKTSGNLLADPAVGKQMSAMQTIEAAEQGKTSAAEQYLEKAGSLTSDSTDSSVSETYARINISTPTLMGYEATTSTENERERVVGQSVFAGHLIGQSQSLEMERNISTQDTAQRLHEAASDVCDIESGNNDAADMANNIYLGPIPLSGSISYSGPIAYSGSVSLRSDSSTTSTRSFAFPILASEWNSSPVKMARADSRFFKKKRCWNFRFFCCRS